MRTRNTGNFAGLTALTGLAGLLFVGVCLSTATLRLEAQSPRGSSGEVGPQYIRGAFESSAPAIGEPMHDLTVYDPEGKEIRLRDVLNGRHTVLILGCLT